MTLEQCLIFPQDFRKEQSILLNVVRMLPVYFTLLPESRSKPAGSAVPPPEPLS